MKDTSYSTAWIGSSKARKQRKFRYNAPLHLRRAFLSAHLSKSLRAQHKRRAIPIRSGDKVAITTGSSAGKSGTVDHVNVKTSRIYITGIERMKRDGSKILLPVHPSNVVITDLDMGDRRRLNKQSKGESKSAAAKKPAGKSQSASPAKPAGMKPSTLAAPKPSSPAGSKPNPTKTVTGQNKPAHKTTQ